MEERERADKADRVYLASLHRELAQELDRRADECEAGAEHFDTLAEKAADVLRQQPGVETPG